jgi:hypothetical protein
MYCLFIILRFVFLVVVDSDALTLDNLQDLQEQDFEQFEQQGMCQNRFCKQNQVLIACVPMIIYSTLTDKKCS